MLKYLELIVVLGVMIFLFGFVIQIPNLSLFGILVIGITAGIIQFAKMVKLIK